MKLSYIEKQLRVRCEFTRADTLSASKPPKDLLQRAIKKLEDEQAAGRIAFYRVFETRFYKVWDLLRRSAKPNHTGVAVTLASGAPPMEGIIIEPPTEDDDDCLGYLTIKANVDEVTSWQHHFLKLTVGKRLRELNITEPPNPAQVKRIFLRAKHGFRINRQKLLKLPDLRSGEGKPYVIHEDRGHHDVTMVVYDLYMMRNREVWNEAIHKLHKIQKIARSRGIQYQILFNDIVRTLRSSNRGPERFGIDMPLVLLAAFDATFLRSKAFALVAENNIHIADPSGDGSSPSGSSDAGLPDPVVMSMISVSVDSSQLSAKINPLTAQKSQKIQHWISREHVDQALQDKGVVEGLDESAIDLWLSCVQRGERAEGATIANGFEAVNGDKPYLEFDSSLNIEYEPFANEDQGKQEDGEKQGNGKDTKDQKQELSRSDGSNLNPIAKGMILATIEYQQAPMNGLTVTGKTLEATKPSLNELKLGDGLELQGNAIISARSGCLKFNAEDLSLELTDDYVHRGDMTPAHGSFDLTGNVTVTGSIKAGSKIYVEGDLVVQGIIEDADLVVKGSLTVRQGITGCVRNPIMVTRDIRVQFIQNSEVHCGNDIFIEKSSISSKLTARNSILGDARSSKFLGGVISAEQGIVCNQLGSEQGDSQITVNAGTSLREQQAVERRKLRLQKVIKEIEQCNRRVQKIEQTPVAQRPKQKTNQLQGLKERISRLEALQPKVENALQEAKAVINYNDDASISAHGSSHQNVRLFIGKRKLFPNSVLHNVMFKLQGDVIQPCNLSDTEMKDAS